MSLFQRQLKKGRVGEELSLNYLINKGWNVEDVSANEEYFNLDIDFIAEKNGTTVSLDVKTEEAMNRTGNMFIETGITYLDGKYKGGWLRYSKAEYIWHINPVNSMAFAYRLEDMKEYIKKNRCKMGSCRDEYKTVDGCLIKPEEYKNSGYWWQEMNLKEIF